MSIANERSPSPCSSSVLSSPSSLFTLFSYSKKSSIVVQNLIDYKPEQTNKRMVSFFTSNKILHDDKKKNSVNKLTSQLHVRLIYD